MAACCRHLGFLKFKIFNDRKGQEGRTVSNFVEIAQTMANICRFSKFQIFHTLNGHEGRIASLCKIASKSLQARPKYGDFSIFFQDNGCLPSGICNACVGTTNKGHLVVFIIVQNLVGIDAVVLIICTFFVLASLA